MIFDKEEMAKKTLHLSEIAAQLKGEFFGMDVIIDKVISSINVWYTLPQIVTRPIIINLWGMTGVGKTQLVRRLVDLLGFGGKFVEVQMDGITSSSSNYDKTISSILDDSSIEESQPGILLLDEMQRYRTIDNDGHDVRVERFQDVWMLLSDGKFPAASSLLAELEMMVAQQQYSADWVVEDQDELELETDPEKALKKTTHKRKFSLYPGEAKRIKKILRLQEPVTEIMKWDSAKVAEMTQQLKSVIVGKQVDYTKLLIFISGNLDEAFRVANDVNDCDTDADIFYRETLKVTVTNIKNALRARFKPEQISRLGNNHIIYPSLTKKTYQLLIENTVNKYLKEMENISGVSFSITESAKLEIYNNSVYPSQGTRPVFSSIHKICGDSLIKIVYWAVSNGIPSIALDINGANSTMVGSYKDKHYSVQIDLDIREQKKKSSVDFNTLVAVHESGHALVAAILTKAAPQEIKINVASFTGGYTITSDKNSKLDNYSSLQNKIAILLAGNVAERLIFGDDLVCDGSASDIMVATALATQMIRKYGMNKHVIGYISGCGGIAGNDFNAIDGIRDTQPDVIHLLNAAAEKAKKIIQENMDKLMYLSKQLILGETISQNQFIELFPDLELGTVAMNGEYALMFEQKCKEVLNKEI